MTPILSTENSYKYLGIANNYILHNEAKIIVEKEFLEELEIF